MFYFHLCLQQHIIFRLHVHDPYLLGGGEVTRLVT